MMSLDTPRLSPLILLPVPLLLITSSVLPPPVPVPMPVPVPVPSTLILFLRPRCRSRSIPRHISSVTPKRSRHRRSCLARESGRV
ncbi:hypothetical protein B0F90DRAFT_1752395, partial [Multifurca ochricompacta]